MSALAESNSTTPKPNGSVITKDLTLSTNDLNIAFELPDLVVSIENELENIQIEAFRVLDNDKILQQNDSSKHSQLRWVSVGHPRLVEKLIGLEKKPTIFHFTQSSFYTYIEMLTDTQKQLFVDAAKYKYKIDSIQSSQIVNLILSKFECKIDLYDTLGNHYIINGKVTQFKEFPLRMDFLSPLNTKERTLLVNLLNTSTNLDIQLDCEIGSQGKELKVNTFTITTELMTQLDLVDNLFGPANETYVSREQMTSLASNLYTKMDIIEEYQMPEFQFKETFIDDFIKLTASSLFANLDIYSLLDKMSHYSISFLNDLKPDIIKSESSKIFKVETLNTKSRIIVDQQGLENLKKNEKVQVSGGGGAGFLNLFNFQASLNVATEKSSDWLKENKTLTDQLNEMNQESKNDVQWQFEGEKIIPKSINVAKIMKSKFSQTLIFTRIRQQYYTAPFIRTFSLYTVRKLNDLNEIEKITNSLTKLNNQLSTINNTLLKTIKDDRDNNTVKFNSLNNIITNNKMAINNINEKLRIKCFTLGGDKLYTYQQHNPAFVHGYGDRYIYDTINFSTTFIEPPNVTVALTAIDIDTVIAAARLYLYLQSVNTTSFNIKLYTYLNTRVYHTMVRWFAYGCIHV